MKRYGVSCLHSKIRSDGGPQMHASSWLQQNSFRVLGSHPNSESHTAEWWENPPTQVRRTLPSGLASLHLDNWLKPSWFVQDHIEPTNMPVCLCVCVCVPTCLGSIPLHMKNTAEEKIMLPWLEKMRSFVSGLLKRTSFSWSAVARLHL